MEVVNLTMKKRLLIAFVFSVLVPPSCILGGWKLGFIHGEMLPVIVCCLALLLVQLAAFAVSTIWLVKQLLFSRDAINSFLELPQNAGGAQYDGRIERLFSVLAQLQVGIAEFSSGAEHLELAVDMIFEFFHTSLEASSDAIMSGSLRIGEKADKSQQYIESIERTFTQTINSAKQMEALCGGIKGILGELKKLTYRSKMLSLNATIEAARVRGTNAGGFKVVAAEVKQHALQFEAFTVKIEEFFADLSSHIELISIATGATFDGVVELQELLAIVGNEAQYHCEDMTKLTVEVGEAKQTVEAIRGVTKENVVMSQSIVVQVKQLERALREIQKALTEVQEGSD